MRTEYLQYILEVKKHKSISKAAKALFVSQPSLSIAISNVESEVGYTIFERNVKGVVLTPSGEKLCEMAEKILDDVEKLKQFNNKKIKNIDILAVPMICNDFLIDLVENNIQDNGHVILNFHEMRNNKVIRSLIDGTAYLGIGFYTNANKDNILSKLKKHKLSYIELLNDRMMAFISKKDILSYEESIVFEDLEKKNAILFVDNEPMYEIDDEISNKVNKGNFIFSDKTSVKSAIAKNLGYAILPSIMAVDDLYVQTGLIRVVPISNYVQKIKTILIFDPSRIEEEEKYLIEDIQDEAARMQEKIDALDKPIAQEKLLDIQIYY
ncbi:MAG: LysR family transcriptional regulator [Erysipelotrichaceae bacterium]|nr:LysR family transcriptional regulator [Erysipelotrichaceae bacterium]